MSKRAKSLTPSGYLRRIFLGRIFGRADPLGRMKSVLSADLTADTEWSHGDRDLKELDGDYYRHWKTVGGGHKVYSYFDTYERVFSSFRGQRLSVLEIGVFRGASLRTWRWYLGDQTRIVGLDIDPDCARFDDSANGMHVRIGDSGDPRVLDAVAAEFGPFDIVIDDGSHYTHHQMLAFNTLFARHLKPGGIFFIEDTCTSAWRRFRTSRYSVFDLAKTMVDAINYFYFRYRYADYDEATYRGPFSLPKITTQVRELRVFDSAIAICKADAGYYPPLVFQREVGERETAG